MEDHEELVEVMENPTPKIRRAIYIIIDDMNMLINIYMEAKDVVQADKLRLIKEQINSLG